MNRYQRMADAYIERLSHEVAFLMGDLEAAKIKLALTVALTLVNEDIATGEVVPLPLLGEFSRINQGEDYAGVRYRVDVALLNRAQSMLQAGIEVPPASQLPIEDWPIDEDNRFRRAATHGA